MKVLAIIPARAGSKRIKGKNLKHFLGKEIISYPIETLVQSSFIESTIVSTDSLDIKSVAEKYGAEVPFLRSDKNSDDFATTFDVIEEVVSNINHIEEYDYICCMYPTSIFISAEILEQAFIKLKDSKANGLVTVLEYSHPIQRALEINQAGLVSSVTPEFYNSRSQDLEPRYHDAGQLYIFKLSSALASKKLIVDNTVSLVIPQSRAQDIDTIEDWKLAEIKYQYINNHSL